MTLLAAALVVFALSMSSPWVRVLLLAAAGSFLAVAAGYGLIGAWVFGKLPTGRRHRLSLLLLLPHDVTAAAVYHAARLTDLRTPFVEVAPNLLLGRRLTNREARAVEVAHVLDLACEFNENTVMRAAGYRSLPVLDTGAPTADELAEAVAWLREAVAAGPTYVHCALGHSRSASIVLAYLLHEGLVESAEQGEAHLRSLRPGVRLSPAQRAAVRRFASTLPPRASAGAVAAEAPREA